MSLPPISQEIDVQMPIEWNNKIDDIAESKYSAFIVNRNFKKMQYANNLNKNAQLK